MPGIKDLYKTTTERFHANIKRLYSNGGNILLNHSTSESRVKEIFAHGIKRLDSGPEGRGTVHCQLGHSQNNTWAAMREVDPVVLYISYPIAQIADLTPDMFWLQDGDWMHGDYGEINDASESIENAMKACNYIMEKHQGDIICVQIKKDIPASMISKKIIRQKFDDDGELISSNEDE